MILNGFLVGLSIFRRCLWSFVYTLPSFLTRVVLFPLFSFSWLWSHISNQSCNCKSKRKEWVSINHKHGIRSVDAYLDATVNFISGLLYSKEPFSLIPTVSESLESSLWSLSQTFLRNVFFRYIFFLCFFVSGQWTHTQNWTTRFPFACFLSLGHEKMRRQVKNGYINKKEKRHQHIHRFHSRHSRGNDRLSRNESESSKGKSTDLSFQEHDESRNTADDSFCCWYHQLSRSEGESARELLNVNKKRYSTGICSLGDVVFLVSINYLYETSKTWFSISADLPNLHSSESKEDDPIITRRTNTKLVRAVYGLSSSFFRNKRLSDCSIQVYCFVASVSCVSWKSNAVDMESLFLLCCLMIE